MALVDYGQVPAVDRPCKCKKWMTIRRVNAPEAHRDFVEGSFKWIDAKYLNGSRKYFDGSKALVGERVSTGRWCVICVKEVDLSAS